ncbi:MAG: LacI family transcriptional regulator [Clostridiales bacterium]|jgi:DNA-binding LacI/PurR family transcriptional regulator|nr:LacI family transcriptional regulator [Clostridiales bacterium]
MATIKDVAREAGVSIGTVSKALNGSYTISEEQTRRVKQIAEQLGYKANARAQTFARQASRSAVFLTALPKGAAFENPHMFEIICGAESALREKGYTLALKHCDAKNICHAAKETMASKSADGILFHASVVTKELAAMLGREEIPHIIIGKPAFPNSVCWIDNDNRLSGEIAARHLAELGHTEIAFVGGLEEDKISEDRLAGVESELRSRPQPNESNLCAVYKGESTIAEGKRAGLEILALAKRPHAVICANNYLAYGCLRALQWQNVRVPDDVSLVTFDDYPFALFMNPALTTVSIDVYDMGVQAGKLLVSKIKKPGMRVQSFTTLPLLVKRQSTTEIKRCY